ncbi:MAG: GNAT family protein [Roseovarius sp.]|nr:GNAT family protein [Roseovarius sp.]MCY4208552.1 GNAT family protein [Roseovarius sp.]MCY4290947.1 GNAT family protein [Roseovarius sp.]MCY4317045.1 GNAT family protein [Roseovarius sp.]
MLLARRKLQIETERLTLREPRMGDYTDWSGLRDLSADFLTPWEPQWMEDHLTRKDFANRVDWAHRSLSEGSAVPLFLIRRDDQTLVGAITMDNIRRGPSQSASLGYWTGKPYCRRGYMREALDVLVHHAFERMDLSRIEAACLPGNNASRRLLEKCGFKYEGVAQSYLQINGRWRNHVLYASLRPDRRGRTDSG